LPRKKRKGRKKKTRRERKKGRDAPHIEELSIVPSPLFGPNQRKKKEEGKGGKVPQFFLPASIFYESDEKKRGSTRRYIQGIFVIL